MKWMQCGLPARCILFVQLLEDKEESTSPLQGLLICQGSLSSICTRRWKERIAAAFFPLPKWILGICTIGLRNKQKRQNNWACWNIKETAEIFL